LVLDPKEVDVPTVVKDHTEEGVGVDVALECVGLEASLNSCAKAVRKRGKVVQVGLHVKPASIDAMLWALKDITLEATWCYPTTVWPRITSMIAADLYPVEQIVTSTIDPGEVVERGFDELLDPSGRNMKILVRAS
jgi:(R,R)-butanediol dehydrogenase/meso-butanediol dehydrogenase/diacetyl reductase